MSKGVSSVQDGVGAVDSLQSKLNALVSHAYVAKVEITGAQGLPARAEGGDVMAGKAYIIGEKGPEVFVAGQSGSVIPNSAINGVSSPTRNLSASSGGRNSGNTVQRL